MEEINKLSQTVEWANSLDVKDIESILEKGANGPWLIIGSGGSLSACHYIASLFTLKRQFAKALTPLELLHSRHLISKSNILVVSASGRNKDVLFAFNVAIQEEPKNILAVTMYADTPLAKLCMKYDISIVKEFHLPSGKDGFLATNSLLGFYTIFFRAFTHKVAKIQMTSEHNLKQFTARLSQNSSLVILYSGWAKSIAIDLESKCTEGGLFPSLVSDYRNFGHGRHNWFDKQSNAGIVALISKEDTALAEKTLSALPLEIPRLELRTRKQGPDASIDLLAKSFQLVARLGSIRGIDPGRPGVPSYGRKLYNLSYASILPNEKPEAISKRAVVAIERKLKAGEINSWNYSEFGEWEKSYKKYVRSLNGVKFGALVVDYDGTICSQERRYKGIDASMGAELRRLAESGFSLAIVTGRGKSVRDDLQKHIPPKLQHKVLIGYYNGGVVGELGDVSVPDKTLPVPSSLTDVHKILTPLIKEYKLKATARPWQLTIEVEESKRWCHARIRIFQAIMIARIKGVSIVESSHSMDIISIQSSKLSIFGRLNRILSDSNKARAFLCIGDRGVWPGNDFELLSTEYSLSVDEVSPDPNSCWNLASVGIRGAGAALWYLRRIAIHDNYFKIKIPL